MRELLDNARLRADARALQGLPDRRSAHAVEGGVQLDAEDAGGAAASTSSSCSRPPIRRRFPVTVLSRCLQFNLKQMPPAQIVDAPGSDPRRGRRSSFEPTALRADRARRRTAACATRCRCSTRRSPTAAASVREDGVRDDARRGRHRVRAADPRRARRERRRRRCSPRPTRWRRAASRSRRRWRISRALAPARARADGARGRGRRWTTPSASRRSPARLAPEDGAALLPDRVQGRADLPLAPDEATGFTMTLLRMLAFAPAKGVAAPTRRGQGGRTPRPPRAAGEHGRRADAPLAVARRTHRPRRAARCRFGAPLDARRAARRWCRACRCPRIRPRGRRSWRACTLAPMAAQLAAQTELKSVDGNVLTLALPAAHKHLADKAVRGQAARPRSIRRPGRKWMLAFEVGSPAEASLAAQKSREQRGAEGARRGGVSRRAVRAGRARPLRCENKARFDQAGVLIRRPRRALARQSRNSLR